MRARLTIREENYVVTIRLFLSGYLTPLDVFGVVRSAVVVVHCNKRFVSSFADFADCLCQLCGKMSEK